MKSMARYLVAGLLASVAGMIFTGQALAQSGHFVGEPVCRDIGTQVNCTGKVAGLGGTTFEITITAPGVASVECTNPGGNVAPGQDTEITPTATTGPRPTPRNGAFRFGFATTTPTAPADACPNDQWTGAVTDVAFTTATIQLREDGNVSDEVTVPVT